MENYKKVTLYLNEELATEVVRLINYRNSRLLVLDIDKKPTSIEEFATGCIIHYLKEVKHQKTLAGYDDLGKPFRMKNRIKEYLQSVGMKQKDLAQMTDIDPANISYIINNKSQPSLDYFLRIWIALKCPPLDKILYREKEEK